MASLFTNASAMTALQTLSASSKSLAATQNRVSTGLRINTAADNAAYWSIATTLRSDVGALKAVGDALGLGAATVDTVYTGINDTKDILDQIKSKLVTASQAGVPRAQVQAEITQLQNRLNDMSKSTVINSESWLTQDSSAAGYNSTKTVVGSFTRTGGAITLDNIEINISQTKLYENSTVVQGAVKTALGDTGGGALQAYVTAFTAINAVGGITDSAWNTNVSTVSGDIGTAGEVLGNVGANNDIATALSDLAAVDETAALDSDAIEGFVVAAFGTGGADIWGSLTADERSQFVSNIQSTFVTYQTAVGNVTIVDSASITAEEATALNDLKATFSASLNSTLNNTFGVSRRDSVVASMAAEARNAFEATAAADSNNASLGIFDKVRTVVSNADGSNAKAIRVSDMDISKLTDTDFDRGVLTSYLKATDDALQELTLSASVVGAAKARIEGNQTFAKNLIDANNRGIGQLVDADLNEESSKLKAVQVQQQLAIQALNIANGSTQQILSLFQG